MKYILNTNFLNSDYDNYDNTNNIYNVLLSKLRNIKCNVILEEFNITDNEINEYINGISSFSENMKWYSTNDKDKITLLKKNVISTDNNNIDVILSIKFEKSIKVNYNMYKKFLLSIVNNQKINWIKNIKICCDSEYDYYIKLISEIYGIFKEKSINLISCDIDYNNSDFLIKKDILQYVDKISIINGTNNYDENLKYYLEYTFINKEIIYSYDKKIITDNSKQYFYDTQSILKLNNFGIVPLLRYEQNNKLIDLNKDSYNYNYMSFIINEIYNYKTPVTNYNREFDNINIDSIQFSNNYNEKITIIWDNSTTPGRLDINPQRNEYYKILTNDKFLKVSNSYSFNNYDGYQILILKQKNSLEKINLNSLNNKLFNKFIINDMSYNELLDSLPNEFNKDIYNLNINRLLASINDEISDAKCAFKNVYNNQYLETVNDEYIYKNFGVLTGYEKQPNQSYEQYKNIIKKLIAAILYGNEIDRIIDLVDTIVNYDYNYNNGIKNANVDIIELYNEATTNYEKIYGNNRLQINLESILDINPNKLKIYKDDILNVLDIVKPAHVFVDVTISYSNFENLNDWFYEKNEHLFNESDEFSLQYTLQNSDMNYNSLNTAFQIYGFNGNNYGSVIYSPILDNLDEENSEFNTYPIGIRTRINEEEFTLTKI